MLVEYLKNLFNKAADQNQKNILTMASSIGGCLNLLDLGCDDGNWTAKVAKAAGAKVVCGVEIVQERALLAQSNNIEVVIGDLNKKIEINEASFDLIHANQVIEHVEDVDHFAEEVLRILKPGGYAIISTENASSWHNIFSLIFGWQMFSLTNMSSRRSGIGNPMSLHRGINATSKSWTHKTIFSLKGLTEFFAAHNFKIIQSSGAGYYPLPGILGSLDKKHSHFISILIKKI
jgi:2-polyprenyl-3-methyl-5-hydroxy-6-metoxy-1,4-benzoquinol methylase